MDNLLLQHGCASHYNIPDGLKELMSDITREVLREQPHKIFNFVADYLSVLLITRENSMIAFKVLHDLCDCKPMLVEHLVQLGFTKSNATMLADEIKREVEIEEPVPGQEHTQELFIIKKLLSRTQLDKEIFSKVSKIAIDTYREYWYKKKAMEKCVEINTDEPWEVAVERTLDIYKKTNPSMIEFNRAAEIIQTAYYHYYNHRTMLNHLMKKPKAPATEKKPTKTKLGVLRHKLDNQVNVELGSMLSIESKDNSTEERNMTQKITHILNDEEDSVPVERSALKLGGKKSAKKTFKFVEPNTQQEPQVTVSYTQVAICPQFGKTEQNLGSLVQNENEISVPMDNVIDGAGDNNEIIPEIIKTQNEYDEESDDYDIPEDFSDTDSGPRNHTPVSAIDALISDIEEDYK